ncbi:MAG: UDP-N-acetylmuramoyl-L-alanyl-D-glutamate--2,6-diaminopimelate ligase [Gammaproteobacteria bacterium]|nr:UDP-N-acetylmuramoyl-L-alanyl-D-glutamate--2,6-diaminopimelate ligase [Gammaproteobacteria bacterium]
MALDQLLEGYAVAASVPALTVTGLNLDSRRVSKGEVYLALKGTLNHGLQFAANAEAAGACAVLVDVADLEAGDEHLATLELPVIPVRNLADVAGPLASRFFGHPTHELEVCGVTGTDGKTSVCRFISEALREQGIVTGYIGTIGWGVDDELEPNPLTTPDPVTLQRMFASLRQRGATVVALEVSSHALSQGRVNGVSFDVAVLTNLGRDHLDYHGSVENYSAAKEKLFAWPGLAGVVLNLDDDLGRTLNLKIAATGSGPTVMGYSTTPERKTECSEVVLAGNIVADENGLSFDLHDATWHHRLCSPLLGRFNVQNLLASYGALRLLGVAANDASNQLSRLRSVPGRMEHFTTAGAANAVIDFAHTPQALEAAINSLRPHCRGRLIVVFGCGGDRDTGKRPLMGSVAARLADVVIVTDDNPRTEPSQDIIREIMLGIKDTSTTTVISDRGKAITEALQDAANDDWVLIAGKGHEDYQVIGTTRYDYSDRALVEDYMSRHAQRAGVCGGEG